MPRALAILLAWLTAFNLMLPGSGSAAVLCLGGGHHHAPGRAETCAHDACEHDAGILTDHRTTGHDEDCGCTDIAVFGTGLVRPSRTDPLIDASASVCVIPTPWRVVAEHTVGRPVPPRAPPEFDRGGEHRLTIVSIVRLLI